MGQNLHCSGIMTCLHLICLLSQTIIHTLFSMEGSVNSHDSTASGGPVQNYNQLFLTENHPAPQHTPDPWQLLISVCPSSLCSSQLLRPLSPLQINYKRLGNHSNSIWPRAPGLVFDLTPVCLSMGTKGVAG